MKENEKIEKRLEKIEEELKDIRKTIQSIQRQISTIRQDIAMLDDRTTGLQRFSQFDDGEIEYIEWIKRQIEEKTKEGGD